MIIDNELLAAYAEGNVTQEEREAVRHYLADNPDMMETVLFAMDDTDNYLVENQEVIRNKYSKNLDVMLDCIDAETENPSIDYSRTTIIPMTAMAAQNTIDNLCVIKCEGIALRHFGMDVKDDELLKESESEGWLKVKGTALHNIGRLCGNRGLSVSHRYQCTVKEIEDALLTNSVVIAVVDGNELIGDSITEKQRDISFGLTPNHAIIIRSVNKEEIEIIDTATSENEDQYPLSQFIDAWNDSLNYLIIISDRDEYIPHPINLDDVIVEDELIELREAIAENAHEVWAEARKNEGWTYGSVRDDEKKQHPDMLPYNLLPDSEKEYDRLMAMNTIKLLKKLGWKLNKE